MAVNVQSPEGLFDTSHNLFRLYNAYSIANGHTRSVSPVDLFPQHDFPTLVLGDSIFATPLATQLACFPATISL